MQRCPNCKIINPETAVRCDCGYDFGSKMMKESYLARAEARKDGMDVDPAIASMRREHLRAEADVKGVGGLLIAAAIFSILRMLRASEGISPLDLGSMVAAGISGLLLRNLDAKGRWLYTLLIAVTQVAGALVALFQIGDELSSGSAVVVLVLVVLWPALILSILWSRKGRMVTSAYYRDQVVAATPQLKPGTPVWLIIAFVLTLLVLLIAEIAAA